jgi:DedD protein
MDKALKQRLVGASVLIALAVIVLPMLLNGRPQGSTQQSQKIDLPPKPDELSFETRRFPVSESTTAARVPEEIRAQGSESTTPSSVPRKTVEPAPNRVAIPTENKPTIAKEESLPVVASAATSEQSPVQVTPDPAPREVKQAPPSLPPPQTVESGSSGSRYVVQVASLGSSENASRLMKSLQQNGYSVLMDVIESDVGRLNRVRVGPFGTESDASRVSARIDKEIDGVAPRVLDLQPDKSAAVTNPSDPLVRWVVQVGSFSEVSNADRLVEQLRSAGQTAYREAVSSATSSIFRVRVGPFIERDVALLSQKDLRDRLSIDGVVMSAD